MTTSGALSPEADRFLAGATRLFRGSEGDVHPLLLLTDLRRA